jgi:AcrR family transcriptional regulator
MRRRILDASFERLAREGYAKLSLREIGRDAGINHALISYHFGSKDELVIAVLDDLNARLLERQQRMYSKPGAFADKWRQAVRFYEVDLGSGFVRVLIELYAASLSNAELRAAFQPRMAAWYRVVRDATAEAIAAYGLEGTVSPDVAAAAIGNFWMGMELAMLCGIGEEVVAHRAALRAFEDTLRRLDARVGAAPAEPRPRPGGGPARRRAGAGPTHRADRASAVLVEGLDGGATPASLVHSEDEPPKGGR